MKIIAQATHVDVLITNPQTDEVIASYQADNVKQELDMLALSEAIKQLLTQCMGGDDVRSV